jgi:hypothetical protein
MSFNIPIESDIDVIISGPTINIPAAVTSSGDVGILRQASSRDLVVTGSVGVYQETDPWNINGSITVAGYTDSPSIDAFARLRVSNPVTLFENKQVYDDQPLLWANQTANGGAIIYNSDRASSTLSINGTNGSSAIRQSKQRINYQPGKSLLLLNTFVLGLGANNVRKRAGLFNENNGIYLQQNNSVLSFVVRSFVGGFVSENVVNQSSWNLDRLDGTGPSGVTLDITKAQILLMDIEWLGVGRIRIGFIINGIFIYAHEFNHANIIDSVYMSSPNLPVRYEITNTAAGDPAQLEEICSTAISEGGNTILGILRSANRGTTGISVTTGNGLVPLISIRLKSAYVGATLIPVDFSIISAAATTYIWKLIVNPTVAGTDLSSWVPLSNSAAEYNVTRTAANALSGGTIIKSGYIVGQGNTVGAADAGDLRSLLVLSADIAGIQDELVLAIQRIGPGGGVDFFGSISWRELF